jgi:hypothetical protein
MRAFLENVVEAIRASAAERGNIVRQARWQTRAVLAEQRARRQAVAQSLRRSLHQNRAAVIESVKAALAPVTPTKPNMSAQPGIPDSTRAPLPRRSAWEFIAEPLRERQTDGPMRQLERQVLEFIINHPHGVRPLEIGNALGVDWRRVLSVAGALVEAGVVDQVNDEFYPAGKVSGTW